jgi:hypothetical protein
MKGTHAAAALGREQYLARNFPRSSTEMIEKFFDDGMFR